MQVNTYPQRYPDRFQAYDSPEPYPMGFTDAPSYNRQILVNYGGQPMLQGLSTTRGPFMFPVRTEIFYPTGNQIMYPPTHSIPTPYQQFFINASGNQPIISRGYYGGKGCRY